MRNFSIFALALTLGAAIVGTTVFAASTELVCKLTIRTPEEEHSRVFRQPVDLDENWQTSKRFQVEVGSGRNRHPAAAHFSLEYSNQHHRASLQLVGVTAELSGAGAGRLEWGQTIGADTVNDYEFGDGSDASVECWLGMQVNTTPEVSEIVCRSTTTGSSSPLQVVPMADAVDGRVASLYDLGATVSFSRARGTITLHPSSDMHGGFTITGVGTASVPLEAGGISCHVR